jgi:hypothetical protein
MRTWVLYVWTGKKYQKANCGNFKFEARGPQDAIQKAGLDCSDYSFTYSRKGYGHFTGRVEARLPETVAAEIPGLPRQPADFVLRVVEASK